MNCSLLLLTVLTSYIVNAYGGRATNGDPAPGRSPGPPRTVPAVYSLNTTIAKITDTPIELMTLKYDVHISNKGNISHIILNESSNSITGSSGIASLHYNANVQIAHERYSADGVSSSTVASFNRQHNDNNNTRSSTSSSSFASLSIATTTTIRPHRRSIDKPNNKSTAVFTSGNISSHIFV